MKVFEGTHPNQLYKKVIKYVKEFGEEVSPRGQKTYELQPASHVITNPKNKLCSVPGRKANPFFNMAENMWILAGKADTKWICQFNSKLFEFQGDVDNPDFFNAGYGNRMRFYNRSAKKEIKVSDYRDLDVTNLPVVLDQIHHVYLTLKKDKDSRQAVVTLWHPIFDNFFHKTKDRPCNIVLMFKIRNNKLNMTVCNRSNDVHLGLYGVNFVQFSMIQEFLAASLEVEVGNYVHHSDSLHIYENSLHTTEILAKTYEFDVYKYTNPKTILDFRTGKNIGDYLLMADAVISEFNAWQSQPQNWDLEYNFSYTDNHYIKACTKYLMAYWLNKEGNKNRALELLIEVFESGLEDWAICGMEFICRKEITYHHKSFIEEFLGKNFSPSNRQKILRYFSEH